MEWQSLIIDGYSRISTEVLEPALKGLTKDDLNWQPKPDCNSIGWITWHLSRGQDAEIASLTGEEQLWIKDGWHLKFERASDPEDTGFGHTSEQVAAFKSPSAKVQLEYYKAVFERTKRFISTLSAVELDRELDEPWYQPPPTVGVRLVSVMCDGLVHAGEVSYLRGLLKGKGWLSF